MLKKMRWRFIGAAMAAFSAVIFILVCFVNVWNYYSVTSQQDEALSRLIGIDDRIEREQTGSEPPFFDEWAQFSPEVQYSLRFFSVSCSADGEIEAVNQDYIASVSYDDAKTYARRVLSGGKTRGYESGYRYLVADDDDGGTVVLFLNSERELQTMKSLLWITLAIAGICLVVLLGLVILLSHRAIMPYIKNLETQKQFITNASHELKTPLTAIATSADVLALEDEDNEWVSNIQSQAAKLSKLITNLVTLSRLDEENPFPTRTEFSLSEALWELAEPFASLARAKGREYSQNIEEDLSLVGDRTAIQQTVSILLDNALKYSPERGSIELSAKRSGKRVEITVANTVDGMAKIDDISRLFERFYRGDKSHSSTVSGSGIGLSIASATVSAHGGKISAEQGENNITFKITL